MSTMTMAEAICMALFCCLLGPTLGLSSLQGLDSGRTRRGLFGTGLLDGVLGGGNKGSGGVLGGVLGGGDTGGGGGVLGGVLGGGDTGGGGGVLGGVLGGGDTGGGGGVLGGVLGGGGLPGGVLGGGDTGVLGGVLGGDAGGGLLGGVGGLLNGTASGVLPGGGGLLNGILNQTQLVNLLTGQNGLLGLKGIFSLLGLGNGGPQEPFQWHDILNLQFIRGSWKIIHGTELILNLQTQIVMKLPVKLFRTVTVDVNMTADLAITQDKPGDLKLVLKNCRNLVVGFTVKLPPGLIASLLSNMVNSAIQNTLPAVLCPMFQAWLNIINTQLQALNSVSFGILGQIHKALSTMPISSGHFF
ncbi:BPI fold-containing family B member 4-like isoform X2 [Pantherophis guttatus]|uniref:BPI fold-containing family B member 4-like isoform X2 n=1 Tax=Pantherophis guttatus TaxID=94885 RepID=A0ABM3ZJZ5_PANGU|nr:BPI fold-containing family B member 4-like isoform X2 [Pantherophis guttatus]